MGAFHTLYYPQKEEEEEEDRMAKEEPKQVIGSDYDDLYVLYRSGDIYLREVVVSSDLESSFQRELPMHYGDLPAEVRETLER